MPDIVNGERSGDTIKQSEAFHRQVIENTDSVPFQLIFGSRIGTGYYKYIGGGIKELIGVSPADFSEELFNSLVEEVIPLLPDIPADPVKCREQMALGSLTNYKADIRIRKVTGEQKWINDCSLPIRDGVTGKIIGAQGILMDITGRKKFEEEKELIISLLRAALDATTDGILVVDRSGKITNYNERFAQMWRIPEPVLASADDATALEFVLDQLKNPEIFIGKVKELYGNPDKSSFDLLEFKDGRLFERYSLPQKIAGRPIGRVWSFRDVTERLLTEKALRENEKKYRDIVTWAPLGIYQSSPDGNLMTANESFAKMLGYFSPDDLLRLNLAKDIFYRGDDHEKLKSDYELRDKGFVTNHEVVWKRKDGSPFWISLTSHAVKDESGNVIFYEGFVSDISEHKRAEILQTAVYEISQAADKAVSLDDLFKSVHEIISTVMPAKNFYISLYDEKQDILSFPYFVDEVDSPLPPVKPRKGLTEYVLRTGKSLLCDEITDMALRKKGEVELIGAPSSIWLGVPLIVEDKTIGVMVVQHYSDPDAYSQRELQMLEYVSSQVAKAIKGKIAGDLLRQSEEQFRLISENVADLIAVLDLDGKRIYNSPSYSDLFGDTDALRGTDSFQEIHPEDRERMRKMFRETVTSGIGQRGEYRFLLKDGNIRYIESQGSVIKDKNGKVSQVVVVSRDVTEKKRLEQQFLRSQRMESIGTLAGGIAHDLNNVLAPIMMAVEILRHKNPDKDLQRILDSLESSAQRGADIVRQVLAFARGIEGERLILQPKHIINEIVKISRETFPRAIDIKTEIPKNLWTISADPTQIHQVVLNVAVNARDAMPDGGRLTISAENISIDNNYAQMHTEAKPGSYVMMSIADTGSGIPEKILDKIFEPFFTTKEIGKGTGLGLSTVHAIVKSHYGFINVYSEVGRGTTFKIYFPAQLKDQERISEAERPALPQGNGELILIVDDEASIREITRETLTTNGYNVMTANDGTEAISLYAQNREKINAVITDIMMPIMGGAVTIRALKKMNPEIIIIAASGLITDEVKNLGAHVQAFLTKPYTAEKILNTLHKALHG